MVDRMIMRIGSSGPYVRDLQIALNARLMPSPNLMVNGVFTQQTQDAVVAFQTANWLVADGTCGQPTLDCLYATEAHPPVQHNLRYQAQPAPGLGWVAMIAMMAGKSTAAVVSMAPQSTRSATSPQPIDPEVCLSVARSLGLTYHPPQRWPVARVISLIKQGPVAIERFSEKNALRRVGHSWQCLVLAAARGSHGTDGTTTTLRVYDPDQSEKPGIYARSFFGLIRNGPTTGFGLFTR